MQQRTLNSVRTVCGTESNKKKKKEKKESPSERSSHSMQKRMFRSKLFHYVGCFSFLFSLFSRCIKENEFKRQT